MDFRHENGRRYHAFREGSEFEELAVFMKHSIDAGFL
jgi:hypothetical protein